MQKNEGTIDRVIRVVVGLIGISIVFVGPQTPWGYLGIIPLATGLLGWCPLYTLLGFNTCPMKKSSMFSGEVKHGSGQQRSRSIRLLYRRHQSTGIPQVLYLRGGDHGIVARAGCAQGQAPGS